MMMSVYNNDLQEEDISIMEYIFQNDNYNSIQSNFVPEDRLNVNSPEVQQFMSKESVQFTKMADDLFNYFYE